MPPAAPDGSLDLFPLDSALTAINDILSTFFASEKGISKDISTTLLVQPLVKTRTGAGNPGVKEEPPVSGREASLCPLLPSQRVCGMGAVFACEVRKGACLFTRRVCGSIGVCARPLRLLRCLSWMLAVAMTPALTTQTWRRPRQQLV